MKSKLLVNLLTIALLTGCAQPQYIAAKCPAPTIPPEPHYPFYDLTQADASRPGKVTKACVVSLKMCELHSGFQQRILEGYRHE